MTRTTSATRSRWVACKECEDTRKLGPSQKCFQCGRSVDEKSRCIQCPNVPKGDRCGECGRKRQGYQEAIDD